MNNHIKCRVCSCIYNKDHVCEAEQIEVGNCQCHGKDASTVEQTECCTFKRK